jgi:hypothetical protein
MLNTFDQVAKTYNEIVPIRGARRSENLRPLAERRYWWNRIVQLDENTYALHDGSYMWSAIQSSQEKNLRYLAPIIWERKDDGDYLTIRSHMAGYISVSRYWFLSRNLPMGMDFQWHENGKHYVVHKGEKHYLPKFKANLNYSTCELTMQRDNKVVFKQVNGEFIRHNELQPFVTRKIDKELDKKYADKISELWEWAKIMLPMFGDTITKTRHEYATNLTDGGSFWYWTKYENANTVRAILDDPEHDKRIALAVVLANEVGATDNDGRFMEKADSLYQVRKTIRKVCRFYQVEAR